MRHEVDQHREHGNQRNTVAEGDVPEGAVPHRLAHGEVVAVRISGRWVGGRGRPSARAVWEQAVLLRVASQQLGERHADDDDCYARAERRRLPAVGRERPGDDERQHTRDADARRAKAKGKGPLPPEPSRDDRGEREPAGQVHADRHHQDDRHEQRERVCDEQQHEAAAHDEDAHARHRAGAESVDQPAVGRAQNARRKLRRGECARYGELAPAEMLLEPQQVLSEREAERSAGDPVQRHAGDDDPPAIERPSRPGRRSRRLQFHNLKGVTSIVTRPSSVKRQLGCRALPRRPPLGPARVLNYPDPVRSVLERAGFQAPPEEIRTPSGPAVSSRA